MKKIFCFFLFTVNLLLARPNFTLVPYHTYIKYHDLYKKEANCLGVYASLDNAPHKLEFATSYSNVIFKYNIPKYEQTEIVSVYSYLLNNNVLIKGGLHFVASDDKNSNEGLAAVITGAELKQKKSSIGLELFYSNYSHYLPKELNLLQLHPYFVYHLRNISSKLGSLNIKGDYNYIKPKNANLYPELKNEYSSFGYQLSSSNGKWSTSLSQWFGERAFSLEDGGFTLYNLNRVYNGEYSAKIDYAVKKNAHINLKYSRRKYKDINNKDGHSDSITTAFSYTW